MDPERAASCLYLRSSSAPSLTSHSPSPSPSLPSAAVEQQQQLQLQQEQQPAIISLPPAELPPSDPSSERTPILALLESPHMNSDREPPRSSLSPVPKLVQDPYGDGDGDLESRRLPSGEVGEEQLLAPPLPPPPIQTPTAAFENVDLRELLASLPALGVGGAAVGTAEEHAVLAYLARSLRALEQLGREEAHSQRFQPLASILEDEGNSPSLRGFPRAVFTATSAALPRPLSLVASGSSVSSAPAAVISSTSSSSAHSKGGGSAGQGSVGAAGRPRSLNLSSVPLPVAAEALSFRTPGPSNEPEHKYLHPHHQQRLVRGGGSGSGGPTSSAPNTPIDHFTRSIQNSKAAAGSGADNGLKSPTKSSSRTIKDAVTSKLLSDESADVPPEELRAAEFIQFCLESPDLPRRCTLPALASHLRAIAPSELFGVVGWTSLELEAFLIKHKSLFALDGVSGAMSVSVRRRLTEEAVQKAESAGSPNELVARCAQVYHVARSWGILNLGRHEHVFFDRSLFRDPATRETERKVGTGGSDSDANALDLTRLFRVGERVYFDAMLAGRGSRAKWRATRVWKATAATADGNNTGGANNSISGTTAEAAASPLVSTRVETLKKGSRGVHFADIAPVLIQSPLRSEVAASAIYQKQSAEAACQTLATGDILATRLFNAESNTRANLT